jgi:enoyl-CoA hydratase/carnithine racemase
VRWSRPEKRNAFDSVLAGRLADELESLAANPDLSVVALRPQGPVFCAGWDLDEIEGVTSQEQAAALVGSGRRCLTAIDGLPHVVVSAVERSTLGFGVAMIAHSDVTLVSESARILLPELQHGIVPASVLGDLVAKVGRARALRWCLAGEVPLDEAVASGLVTEVVDADRFEEVVGERIESISRQVPSAVHATKRLSTTLKGDHSMAYQAGDQFAVAMLSSRVRS